jgi:hypothetical protein
MKTVIVFPRGQLTHLDRAALDDADIVAVEADSPRDVVQMVPSSNIVSADDLMMSMLAAIKGSSSYAAAGAFVGELERRLRKREEINTPLSAKEV